MRSKSVIAAVSAGMLVLSAGWLVAGPLNPPPGPVTSTGKTLTEVEPRIAINATNTPGDADSLFKIIQPGSYYLTGNITGVSGKHGIKIVSAGVSVDLNGFDLAGVPGSLDGVSVTASGLPNIAVRNGSVRGWGDDGVDLGSVGSVNCTVENVLASVNGDLGIFVSAGSTVFRCSAYNNGGHGIRTSSGSLVSQCTAYNNTGSGIQVNTGSTVVGCVLRINTLDGINCPSQCLVRDNTCSSNGFSAGDGAGIHATGLDNRIEDNNCNSADRGIAVDSPGNVIVRNTCSGNSINWVIAAGNVFGPIMDRTSPGSAAVSGNSAASSLGTTDANANFTY